MTPTLQAKTQPQTVPTNLSQITIRRDHRCFITGRAGSGKTTLADKLIRKLGYRTAVIDPKGLWEFPGYEVVERYNPDPNLIRQVFRPEDDESNSWQDLTRFATAAWNDPRPLVMYIDELNEVTTPRTAPRILMKWQRLGRQHTKALWTGSQRPKDFPSVFLTESENWFVFDLRHADDRKKVAGFLGEKLETRITERYAFWYANPDLADPLYIRQPKDNGGSVSEKPR